MQLQPIRARDFRKYTIGDWWSLLTLVALTIPAVGFVGWLVVGLVDKQLHPVKYAGLLGPELLFLLAMPMSLVAVLQFVLYTLNLERRRVSSLVITGLLTPLAWLVIINTLAQQHFGKEYIPAVSPDTGLWLLWGILAICSLLTYGRQAYAIYHQKHTRSLG